MFVRTTGACRDEPGHRPLFAEPVEEQPAQPDRRSRRRSAEAGRLGHAGQAFSRRARGHRDLRAARPGLQRGRSHRAGAAARHVQGVHRGNVERHAAPLRPRAGGSHARPPAARRSILRAIDEDRSRRGRQPAGDLASYPPDSDGAAGARSARSRAPMPTTGATTRTTTPCPRAATRPTPTAPHGCSSSARWSNALSPERPARGNGRRLQPHHRVRAEREVGARPHRPRVLPPPERRRCGRDEHLLPEHRHRARHDGEADGGLGRHSGRGSTRWMASASTSWGTT